MLRNRDLLALLTTILFLGCVDPVEPEFEFQEGLVFIEGFASTTPGTSYVIITKSEIQFGDETTVFQTGASVSFKNSDTGETVDLFEQGTTYVPSADFAVNPGERWELAILLADGKQYRSTPEVVLEEIPILETTTDYDPEFRFNEGTGRFEPGHTLAVTFDDPAGEENFYYWTFRSFENLDICASCTGTVYRDGTCVSTNGFVPEYYNYICETDCWRIRFPENVNIFSDEFSDGGNTSNLDVATLPLYTKENMVVELQQFSLTPAAYDYYKVLKDIVDNNGGFNAPPPAALVGNLTNVNDSEDFVLGRFTAVASSTVFVFIERLGITEPAIESRRPINLEPTLNSPHPPPATNFIPCAETRFRTAITPRGWMN